MVTNKPAAEYDVTPALVHGLLADQHPDLADLPLRLVAEGWDNVIYRLGADLAVRLPRRRMAAALVDHEQRWLPELAARLPLPVPAPVRVGRPALGYPWSWSICPWFDGDVAARSRLTDGGAEARRLGRFVSALHRPAPPEAPANPFRGGPVGDLTERVDANLGALADPPVPTAPVIHAGRFRARWDELVALDPWKEAPVWIHGDLHAANVVVADGRICAVIDFGDLTGADPAVDLAVAWMLFDADDRADFCDVAGIGGAPVDDATWARGEAWAMHFALVYLRNSADAPVMAAIGRELLVELGMAASV